MAKIACEIVSIDRASEVLRLAQEAINNCRAPAKGPPPEDAIIVRTHRPRGHTVISEIIPSPAFLRWLADTIEADLARDG